MSNSIAIVAGFFLMLGGVTLVLSLGIYLMGGRHVLLASGVTIAAVVVTACTLFGLFDRRVFCYAVTWLGVW
jgi:hypothetical protein